MKKISLYFSALVMLVMVNACHDPEYVLPTADRQGITSITALFTKGEYAEVEAAKLTVVDPDQSDFVLPIPWYTGLEQDELFHVHRSSGQQPANFDTRRANTL